MQLALNWLLIWPFPAVFLILWGGPSSNLLSPEQAIQWSIFVFYVFLAIGVLSQIVNWQIVKNHKFGKEERSIQIELTEPSLVVADAASRTYVDWQFVSRVENDGRRIIVFIEPRGVFIIPDRCFERRASFDAFYKEMSERSKNA